MGCGEIFDPFGINNYMDPVSGSASLLGFQLTPVSLMTQPWNAGEFIKNDWRMIKHWLVPDMRRDREATVNDSIGNRRIIYGRARVGVQLGFYCSTGGSNEFLHLIAIFCGHPVHSFDEIWLGDKLITDPIYAGKVEHVLFDGTQTTACAEMMTASGGLWTANHKLLGCSYGYFKLTYDETAFATGLPQIKAVIKGMKVFDPRTGLTAWSDNNALCAYHYMLYPGNLGGMGCDADEIDTTTVITAANRCDHGVH